MGAAEHLPEGRRDHVARYARGALIAADALDVVPTPLDQVGAALSLHPAEDLFNLADAPPGLLKRVKGLAGKVLGALAVRERVVYVDRTQAVPKQRFAHGHELGHKGLPWHERAYFADDRGTLDPDTLEELEAEASAFSADLLFNMDRFTEQAHAERLGLAMPLKLADDFQASRRATIRRYVEDSPRPCALLVLGRFAVRPKGMPSLKVLRALQSASFRAQYGPATTLFPSTLPIDAVPLAASAWAAVNGDLATPTAEGEYTLLDSIKGAAQLRYEVFSNSYASFALLYPKPRMTIKRKVRAEWRPTP